VSGQEPGGTVPVLLLDDDRPEQALAETECLRLLGPGGIGRLGYTSGALPEVRLVSYTVQDGVVAIPASEGSAALAALSGTVVVLAVVSWARTGTAAAPDGWSVSLVGALHPAPCASGGPPPPGGVRLLQLRPGLGRGRRLTPLPAGLLRA
jgi:hypothetical protein